MAKLALVVDDSRFIRTMVSATLKKSGFDVIEGGNGKEGLATLTGQRVDLVGMLTSTTIAAKARVRLHNGASMH